MTFPINSELGGSNFPCDSITPAAHDFPSDPGAADAKSTLFNLTETPQDHMQSHLQILATASQYG